MNPSSSLVPLVLLGLFFLPSMQGATLVTPAEQGALIKQYCAGCHNEKLKSGGLALTKLDLTHPDRDAQEWEKVVLKLRAGMMPPSGAPRPDIATLRNFASSIESGLDQAEATHPNPGRPALHRLNRTEYANSVHDLLDLDIDPALYLPADDMSHGFDNMAEVLSVSPTLLDGYVRAAGQISRMAVGDASMSPIVETYALPQTFSQTGHVEGTPFGTRGGIAIRHNFLADGEYRFKLTLYFTTNTYLYGYTQKGEQIEVAVNGERVALFDIDPMMKVDQDLRTPPIQIKAGPQLITASFVNRADGPVDDLVQPFKRSLVDLFVGRTVGLTALPHLRDIGIAGPFNATGVSDTQSRRKVFVCRPASDSEEIPCARKILSALARQAYRRPVTDTDMETLLSVYQTGRNRGDFDSGIRLGVQEIVADPQFVFRFERTPPTVAPGSNYRISDLELASRLSYFLWSTAPDKELIELASQEKLHDNHVLEGQVRRMLADPKSAALGTNFASHWLQLQNLKDVQPDVFLYPDYDDNLAQSMTRETELLFDSILREDRNVTELLTANYTFVDERLAKHYGIPDISGPRFQRVAVTDENRLGLLGQGSILTLTSMANRTSPVQRGKWVMDTILGTPPPTPPPNVPALKESTAGAAAQPVRERLEEHRANAACAACHKMMDPIGFALENFDSVGVWRIHDNGFDVNPTGTLVDGTQLSGPASLRQALLNHSDAFLRTFTVKLLTYALGRGIEFYDMPVVRAVDREAAGNDDRFSSFVLGIVKSEPFQMRRAENRALVPVEASAEIGRR
jgi:hypothetical protein